MDSVDPLTGKSQIAALIEQAIAIEGVDWDQRQIDAMTRLCWRESRYNPTLQNPRSTAFGLYQFLNSTWKGTGIAKTSDPLLQTVAAVRYIEARYGTPKDALAFHLEPKVVNGELQHYY
jgi:SLT domain-containing protein